jgi:glycosyltransferase involved in cell wall biosynthesis
MRKLNIVMVAACPFPARRGTPTRILRLAEALGHRGHRVNVVTYHLGDPLGDVPFSVTRIADIPFYRRLQAGPNYRKLWVDWKLAGEIRAVLQQGPVDLVHAHHYEGFLAALIGCRGRSLPIVYDAHTMLESELPHYRLGMPAIVKRALGRLLDDHIPQRAAHVMAVSDLIRTALIARGTVLPERITTVPNGVEFAHFATAARAAHREAGARRRVIFTGNLAPYQGINLMLKAFAKVVRALGDIELHIVTGDTFQPYRPLALALGVNHLLRFSPDDFRSLPLHLAAADVALNPRGHCAGVPMKLLNYMASGRAVVSCAGSARHLEHGHSGWIVPDGDVDGLAGGMVELLTNRELASRLGTTAEAVMRDTFSWDRSGQLAEQGYLAVVK